ncbi:hypothetical protein FQZ97_671000 [compost metagenome]
MATLTPIRLGQNFVKPSACLSANAQTISSAPASTNNTQAIRILTGSGLRLHRFRPAAPACSMPRYAVKPPSIASDAPVMNPLSAPAR